MDPMIDEDNYDFHRHMNVHQRFPYVYCEDIECHSSWTRPDLDNIMKELKESMMVLLKRRKNRNVPIPGWFYNHLKKDCYNLQ